MDSPRTKQKMSRTAAEIEAYKRARVFLVYTHGELAQGPPIKVPIQTMAIHTGEVCKVVLTEIDDPIAKQFSTNLDRTVDIISGYSPTGAEQPLFAQLNIGMAGEPIYQKRHWYIPGQDNFIMGIYEPIGGKLEMPPEPYIQRLQLKLQGDGLYTGEILNYLRAATKGQRIIVVFVSCSVVSRDLNPAAARLALSTGAAAQRFTQPTPWAAMGLRHRTGAGAASTGKAAGAAAGGGAAAVLPRNPGWGRMGPNEREMFAPGAYNSNNNGEYVESAPAGFATQTNVDQALSSAPTQVRSYWDLALFSGGSFRRDYILLTAEGTPKPAQFPSALALYLYTQQEPSFSKTQAEAATQGLEIKAREITVSQDVVPRYMGGGRQQTSQKVYTLDELETIIPIGTRLLAKLPCGLGKKCLPKYEHLGGKRRSHTVTRKVGKRKHK